MSNILIYSALLLPKMHLSLKKKKKGEAEINFRLKQSTISHVQEDIWLNLAWGPGLDVLDLFLTFHS